MGRGGRGCLCSWSCGCLEPCLGLLGLVFTAQHLHLQSRQVWAERAGHPVLGDQ